MISILNQFNIDQVLIRALYKYSKRTFMELQTLSEAKA